MQVDAGASHSLALAKDIYEIETRKKYGLSIDFNSMNKVKNVIYSWGSGLQSKLGHGNRDNLYNPK